MHLKFEVTDLWQKCFWCLALFHCCSSPQILTCSIHIAGMSADTCLWTSVLWITSKIFEQICTLVLVGTGIRTGFGLGNYPHYQTPYIFPTIINRCMCDILNNSHLCVYLKACSCLQTWCSWSWLQDCIWNRCYTYWGIPSSQILWSRWCVWLWRWFWEVWLDISLLL